MTRLDRLREMRAWIEAEIEAECARASRELHLAADLYDVEVEDILTGALGKQAIKARHASAWLLRQRGLSFPQIGEVLGIDWTTARYACRQIDGDPARRALLLGLEVVA